MNPIPFAQDKLLKDEGQVSTITVIDAEAGYLNDISVEEDTGSDKEPVNTRKLIKIGIFSIINQTIS